MSDIESVQKDGRIFEPPQAFRERAHIQSLEQYRALYARSVNDPEGFWGEQAETPRLAEEVGPRPGLEAALRQVVRRRAG